MVGVGRFELPVQLESEPPTQIRNGNLEIVPERTPPPTFSGSFWERHQRVLRLQREHHGELNERGVRLLGRAARASFDTYQDVRREGLCEPMGPRDD